MRNPRNSADEQALLETLTTQVRLATSVQLSALSRPATVKRLIRRGLIDTTEIVVSAPVLSRPLFCWRPGQPAPNCNALAWKLEKRRNEAIPTPTTICWASSLAVRLVGGFGGRVRQPMQTEHDLGTTAILIRRLMLDKRTRQQWLGEDVFRQEFQPTSKVPDAVLLSAQRTVFKALEYGGDYSARRIKDFHRACCRQELPYELW